MHQNLLPNRLRRPSRNPVHLSNHLRFLNLLFTELTSLELPELAHPLDHRRYIEDHVFSVAGLFDVSVYDCLNAQVLDVGNFVFGGED